ncbi:MAG: transcriptional regulator [Candidatus Micrarchaeia archaeon]
MRHKTDYEDAIYTLIPYFRARTSVIMSSEYGIKQSSIASMLGITQAAVSKYLSGHNGAAKSLNMKDADKYIYGFIDSKISGDDKGAQKSLCLMCQAYKKFACNLMVR